MGSLELGEMNESCKFFKVNFFNESVETALEIKLI